ncbi:TetR/AcrR family transcriptional regulator [Goodfellowiella coeruleoviolacea]|uniref:Transcriptional regulator, TetR family n=1 Tax=Goodfellowiella coeruleoviolacea TaxID=334858 RepID=A0AAE3KK05_9PSEU|nr:TetR/AcrR family transcriptional regulator [Goodfellowiella coeruleoviolacea]MCP2169672.1 transcriptional regulator, TetR family [Goodfellowiella coeruleoviolacea]
MPKRVDHEARRRQIASAVWRLASTRGLDGVGLRDVAAEAGISLGQLQHYFSSKNELFTFALKHMEQLATNRITERVQALSATPSPRLVLRECLAEMLALDDNSRTGVLAQIAYFVRAIHDEQLRGYAQQGTPELRRFFAGLLREGVARGEVPADRDPDSEAMLLIGLIDGLNSYLLLGVHTAEQALRLVDYHLANLFSRAPRPRPAEEPAG